MFAGKTIENIYINILICGKKKKNQQLKLTGS